MENFEKTSLWKRTLARKKGRDADADARDHLRTAFLRFRERAGMVADEIKRAYPTLTVHGITHLDALWEISDLILGSDYPLNPAEAFVLGGAFLVHDLGNGLAAYPQGEAEFRASKPWRDALAVHIRRKSGRAPTPQELDQPPPELAQHATEDALRIMHATQAADLALVSWRGARGEELHLIDDPELRSQFGKLIGLIAHSHWWDISKVEHIFRQRTMGPMVSHPQDWVVDALKIACILRVADAAHLDARRAPAFLMALRRPEGVSKVHWNFQRKLTKPALDNDRLRYTTGEPFSRDEADAFWLCFDALRMVDRELRTVDALLVATHRKQLKARGVVGVDDPTHLSVHIPTDNWSPVDARIHVTDVPALVARLGGVELYGNEPTVPLREMIQNAADAIRARRVLEPHRSKDWGLITIRTGKDEHGTWLEVEDTGLGMSQRVLTHQLLDFGNSYWDSEDMRGDHPGLAASNFEHTGRFGIGFFAVFMWGTRLHVTSQAYKEAETRVLEFAQGLKGRPLLRLASADERVHDGGTRIRVWLDNPESLKALVNKTSTPYHTNPNPPRSLAELVEQLAPTLDVDIDVETLEQPRTRAISANDWLHIDAITLLRRAGNGNAELLALKLQSIYDSNNQCIGRACISGLTDGHSGLAVITVGGLRATFNTAIAGVLLGTTSKAARDDALPIATPAAMAQWATKQARLWEQIGDQKTDIVGQSILLAGGDPSQLPILWHASNPLTAAGLRKFAELRDEVRLVFASPSIFHDGRASNLSPNSIIISPLPLAQGAWMKLNIPHISQTLGEIIAEAWNIPAEEMTAPQSAGNEGSIITSVWIYRRPNQTDVPSRP